MKNFFDLKHGALAITVMTFFMVSTLSLKAQVSLTPLFEEGNAAYNEGDFSKAASLYEQILSMGQHSAALYFNIGNAYYRLNKVAESIYYYEKAKQLDPENEDIKVNTAFAQNMTIDAIESLPESQLTQFQKALYALTTVSTWSKITLVFVWLFALFFSIYLLFKKTQVKRIFFVLSLVSIVLVICSFIITFSANAQQKNKEYAILFSDQLDSWSEPNLRSEIKFSLHEGTKVELLDSLDEWKKIRIANGSEGWIKNASLRNLGN
jgi:tetratricopeptide (TPR) repeat protein|tara:strand:+ start:11866 stop:12660 length:795 start_codon:yes stop_codon:yes gene_type:complete